VRLRDVVLLRDFERDFDCVEEGVLLYDVILLVENVGVVVRDNVLVIDSELVGIAVGDLVSKFVVVTSGENVNKYDEDGLAEDVAELLDVPVIDGLPEILGTEDAPIIAAAPRIMRKR